MFSDASPADDDEEYPLASVEALLAGTLALMTGYAQHHAGCEVRPLMAHKLVHNLAALAARPELSTTMQTVLGRLGQHWTRLEQASRGPTVAETPAPDAARWLDAPAVLQ